MIELFIPGEPVAKGRPRFSRTGITFTPLKTREYESKIALIGRIEMGEKPPLTGPLLVSIQIYKEIPASWSKKKKEKALLGEIRPTGRPDIDNYLKTLDGLNGICWEDDSQICSIHAYKHYSKTPGMYIKVYTIVI